MDKQTEIKDPKIEVKKIPFKCVVCNGFGTLKYGEITCQACNRKGYIIVNQDGQTEYEKTTA